MSSRRTETFCHGRGQVNVTRLLLQLHLLPTQRRRCSSKQDQREKTAFTHEFSGLSKAVFGPHLVAVSGMTEAGISVVFLEINLSRLTFCCKTREKTKHYCIKVHQTG